MYTQIRSQLDRPSKDRKVHIRVLAVLFPLDRNGNVCLRG